MGFFKKAALFCLREVIPDPVRDLHDEVQETKVVAVRLADLVSVKNHHARVEGMGDTIDAGRTAVKIAREVRKVVKPSR